MAKNKKRQDEARLAQPIEFRGKIVVNDNGVEKSLREWLESLPSGGTLRVVNTKGN